MQHMKTYTTTIEKPRLVIEYDRDAESPRTWDGNIGYFITVDRNYGSPDENGDIQSIVKKTGEEAQNQKDHMRLIEISMSEELNEKVLAIYPIVKYEHGGVSYKRGTTKGFDYSNNGFYIVTKESAKYHSKLDKESIEQAIDSEIETYNDYINGNIYRWTLYNEQGEQVDSGGDYYSIEDIKSNLPKEWKDEDLSKYLVNY